MNKQDKIAERFIELFAKLVEDISDDEREAIKNEILALEDEEAGLDKEGPPEAMEDKP